jgi:hypothetical protein
LPNRRKRQNASSMKTEEDKLNAGGIPSPAQAKAAEQ